MGVLFTVIILGIIILVHELGHFLTAKYYKMPVSEFAIGMGPKLVSKVIGETRYSIRMLPLGGFVNIGGMQYEDVPQELTVDENGNEYSEEEKLERLLKIKEIEENNKNGFCSKSPIAKFVVLVAGVTMNFVTALIGIYIMLSVTNTAPPKYTPAVIDNVISTSKAASVLKSGDKIIEINGKKTNSWSDINEEIQKINNEIGKNNKKEALVKFERNGNIAENNIELTFMKETGSYILGIQVKPQKLDTITKIKSTFSVFNSYFSMTFNGLKMLITGKTSINEMTGPIGLPKIVGQAYESAGYTAMLSVFILLSINIGLMNLLPIPALDGGRILFVIPEFLGIKINKKIEERIHMIGMVLLILLMGYIMFSDVLKWMY